MTQRNLELIKQVDDEAKKKSEDISKMIYEYFDYVRTSQLSAMNGTKRGKMADG